MGKLTKDMVDALDEGGIAWDASVSGFEHGPRLKPLTLERGRR